MNMKKKYIKKPKVQIKRQKIVSINILLIHNIKDVYIAIMKKDKGLEMKYMVN